MGQRILTALIALTVVTSGLAGVTAAETGTERAQQGDAASVTFANQTTGGDTVTVDSVTLPQGGYVTVHDATLGDDALGSVAGTSQYLEPGTYENVTVTLTDEASAGTYTAMAHQETDGDRTYEFVASNGQTDGPYTADGGAVVDSAAVSVSASVSMADQPTTGDSVVVDRVVLSEGGFVTVHDASVTEGAVFESIRGTSTYLEAGVHEDVRVELDDSVTENTTLVPMAHRDTDGDETYTFDTSEGGADGPYTAGEDPVVDTAAVTVTDTATATMSDQVTGGNAVTVDSVFVPEGGFVTIHDSSLDDGDTFDSVRGTSMYLEPGYHTDVRVTLDSAVTNDTSLIAMPHMDTDGDESYTFVESSGGADGPYTNSAGIVTDAANVTVSASVSIADQSSDGTTVVIDRVDVSEGGFVAVHDATLNDGAVFDSVVGHSDYLDAGVHENVSVTLDERLTSGQTLIAMPHVDSDGDESYTFVESEGGADGPYTATGDPVVDAASVTIPASLGFESQTTDGESVTVDSVTLQDGGFVTVHDASVTEGAVFESIRGTSMYLGPGTHENVTVTLDQPISEETTLVPMAHRDTDGDESYSFPESEGSADGPYVAGGAPVVASASVTVQTMDDGDMDQDMGEEQMTGEQMTGEQMTAESMTEGTDVNTTGGSGPGFTVIVALLAVVAAALLAARSQQ
ncbi:PGF-CTERM sorting domain-containing protein [Haloarcula sp. S1CR25-12]|uniref:PGF-CTERM sorting domain-containing protein n=1 Tax=Haloarcula saliterrae TaxID=2950534 RepID=A0ABU2F9W1_9EURY|nr:PGF-CTERM sorting domain-containing protein [Haloarcula sp. S1CR25-12]MDS0259063.1 PGF-CTERM sorting domain-containing protein [Haloarcula sp. S1CR25-12]